MSKKRIFITIVLIHLLCLSFVFPGTNGKKVKSIAIKASKILTVTKGEINNGVILLKNGKIEAIGTNIPIPEGYEVIDATGKWVIPGLVDIHCHSGFDVRGGSDFNDMVLPINPDLNIFDSINPDSKDWKAALKGGVTCINTIPGSGTNLAGMGLILKTGGGEYEDRIVRKPGVMKVSQGWNPERRGGDFGSSRMGMSWLLLDVYTRGKEYAQKWQDYESGKTKEKPEFDLYLDHFRGVFRGDYPTLVHTVDTRDVMGTVRMFHDVLGVWVIPSHCTFDGFRIAEELAKRNIHANIGPRNLFYEDGKYFSIAEAYRKAGVEVSIQTDAIGDGIGLLFYQVALQVRHGFDEKEALKSVTINPARAIGIDKRVGSIEEGKDADIVILDGPPFDILSLTELVIIEGEIVYKKEETE